jgi:hypothetical protein
MELNLEKFLENRFQQNCLLMMENFIGIQINKILVFTENCLYLQPVKEEISLK